jgi:hypothetical protein
MEQLAFITPLLPYSPTPLLPYSPTPLLPRHPIGSVNANVLPSSSLLSAFSSPPWR